MNILLNMYTYISMVATLHDALKELIKNIFIYVRAAFWTIIQIWFKICGSEDWLWIRLCILFLITFTKKIMWFCNTALHNNACKVRNIGHPRKWENMNCKASRDKCFCGCEAEAHQTQALVSYKCQIWSANFLKKKSGIFLYPRGSSTTLWQEEKKFCIMTRVQLLYWI